jgi:hypothetical protein
MARFLKRFSGEVQMRSKMTLSAIYAVAAFATGSSQAQNLLSNGNLDVTYQQEIVPGLFLPKPTVWQNVGFRLISGPYENEMSSEPWAGPAPTPITTDGVGGSDWGVFFKPFTGNATDGPAVGHLYQDVAGTPGAQYTLTGWAGAEANFLGGAEFAIEFLNGGGGIIGGTTLDLIAAGLFVDNGEPFDYKQFTIMATAPSGTEFVRARASMINGVNNPAGGGQAFVVDDFVLVVPAPSSPLLGLVLLCTPRRRR